MASRKVSEEEKFQSSQETMEDWNLDQIDNRRVRNLSEKMAEKGKKTFGTKDRCVCPFADCGSVNLKPARHVRARKGILTAFEKPCQHCGSIILFMLKHEDAADGEQVIMEAWGCPSNHRSAKAVAAR